GPAGDARLDAVAVAVAVHVALEELDEVRSLGARADQAHVASDYVQQLGQLVQRGAAEEGAEALPPVVALDAAGRRVGRQVGKDDRLDRSAHRAELEHLEAASVQAHAWLAE